MLLLCMKESVFSKAFLPSVIIHLLGGVHKDGRLLCVMMTLNRSVGGTEGFLFYLKYCFRSNKCGNIKGQMTYLRPLSGGEMSFRINVLSRSLFREIFKDFINLL